MVKILTWISMNLASILAAIQIVIKILKELLTAIVNLVSIAFPVVASEKVVLKIRAVLNTADDWITKIKDALIPKVV